jgi:WXG100 family type VII secretion target
MTEIFVNYAAVQNVEEALQQADLAIGTLLGDIDNTVQTQLNPTWLGTSAAAYQDCQGRWSADMANMQNILKQYAPTLSQMRENYFNTDHNLAIQWEQLTPPGPS